MLLSNPLFIDIYDYKISTCGRYDKKFTPVIYSQSKLGWLQAYSLPAYVLTYHRLLRASLFCCARKLCS